MSTLIRGCHENNSSTDEKHMFQGFSDKCLPEKTYVHTVMIWGYYLERNLEEQLLSG